MAGLEFVRTYLDDVLVITKSSFEDHLNKLERVLARLSEAGLKINAPKCSFGRTSLESLGYWLSREGIAPIQKKKDLGYASHQNSSITVLHWPNQFLSRHVTTSLAFLDAAHSASIQKCNLAGCPLNVPRFSQTFRNPYGNSKFQLGTVVNQKANPSPSLTKKKKKKETSSLTHSADFQPIMTLSFRRSLLLRPQWQNNSGLTNCPSLTSSQSLLNSFGVIKPLMLIFAVNCSYSPRHTLSSLFVEATCSAITIKSL